MSGVPQLGKATAERGGRASKLSLQFWWWLPSALILSPLVGYICFAEHFTEELLRWVFTATAIFTFAHLVLQSGSPVGKTVWKLILDIVVAVGFSTFFIAAMQPPGTENALLEGKKFIYIFAVVLVMFALELIAESTRRLVSFEKKQKATINEFEKQNELMRDSVTKIGKSSGKLEEALNNLGDASKILEEGRFAAIAAKALRIIVYNREQSQPQIAGAVQAALDSIPVWHRTGARISKGSSKPIDGAETAASNAWWKAVQIYHQEEKYDLSRYEFATNVRNYAFMILGVLKEYLEDARTRGNGRKVIVLQASAFPPKDFYNYPCGTYSRRYYVDREFFGTYRRAFSLVLSDPSIVPLRLLFASDVRSTDARANAGGLGWTLDDPEKIYLDCARLKIIPAAVEINEHSRTAMAQDQLKKTHDPAHRRHRLRTTGYPWVPVYADLTDVDRGGIAPRRAWGQRAGDLMGLSSTDVADFSYSRNSQKVPFLSRFKAAMSDYGALSGWIEERERNLWASLLESCWKQIRQDAPGPDDIVTELSNHDRYSRPTDGAEEVWSEARKIGTDVLQQVNVKRQALLDGIAKLCARDSNNVSMDTLELVERVQELDSRLAVLSSLRGQRMAVKPAVLGGAMGLGESWLYGFLNLLDWLRTKESVIDTGPMPAWNVFRRDLLGQKEETNGILLDKHRLQLVVVEEEQSTARAKESQSERDTSRRDLPQPIVTVSSMEEDGIYPEFLIIAELDCAEGCEVSLVGGDLFSRLKQGVLIGVDMSEPLQTCRIEFDFQADQSDQTGPLSRHLKWLKGKVLPRSSVATDWFLKKLTEELKSVQPTS